MCLASDADRNRTATILEREVGTGRLTLEECDDRVARVYRARTIGELAAATADLPAPVPPPVPNSGSRSLWAALIATALVVLAGILVLMASPAASAMTGLMRWGMGCG
jgi:hypothetical protein